MLELAGSKWDSPRISDWFVKQNSELPEWKESSNGHVDQEAPVPRGWGDLTGNVFSPTGGIKITGQVLPHYPP